MQTLIILGHPNGEQSHTQQFLKESLEKFPNVKQHTISHSWDVEAERILLKQAERIIFQFPVYWYGAPGHLKTWIDTIFHPSMSYLKGKELGIVASFGVAEHQFQAGGREHFTPSEMFRPFEMLANYFQMMYLPIFCVFKWMYQSEGDKQKQLIEYQMYVSAPNPCRLIDKGKWLSEQLQTINTDGVFDSLIETMIYNNEEIEQLLTMVTDIKHNIR
ncbi:MULTISPECIES: NAD(P)H-dependent oxidoreductase [unclassified Granulicatella]|uniref:NAD(P)H-dependent oxidoreductase n=1 Tax=unclassified Granulicatella TaxID=2630493 RepID=UPI00142FAE52|nr:NAD(P)H-dependent oxidoreductase [Granulicatella sp. WM01]MBF0780848.1 NAD(P)H-dependent oxidoreductase [Granulicatella sp. 19428wC4_WM01]